MDIVKNENQSLKIGRKYSDENEILSLNQNEKIHKFKTQKLSNSPEKYEITSEELEDIVVGKMETVGPRNLHH